MNFGKRFKQVRQEREFGREETAKSLGIDEKTLILIEDDLLSPLLRLAKEMLGFLDMSFEEFFEDEFADDENEE